MIAITILMYAAMTLGVAVLIAAAVAMEKDN
jgi:hypothetical protein